MGSCFCPSRESGPVLQGLSHRGPRWAMVPSTAASPSPPVTRLSVLSILSVLWIGLIEVMAFSFQRGKNVIFTSPSCWSETSGAIQV